MNIDELRLSDPVAAKTGWSPLIFMNISFQSHMLTKDGFGRYAYKPTLVAKLFPIGIIGLPIYGWRVRSVVNEDLGYPATKATLPFLDDHGDFDYFICAMFAIGLFFLCRLNQKTVFDLTKGEYRKRSYIGKTGTHVNLSEIHAIQLLAGKVNSGTRSARTGRRRRSYRTYELNLVLKNSERVHVVSSGLLDPLREDASFLSTKLKVPVWRAV